MPDYLDLLEKWLLENGRSDLVQLIGELSPGDKTRVPLQAADLAMWHIRRHDAGESEPNDFRRLRQMFNERKMTLTGLTHADIDTILARYLARLAKAQAGGDAS
jgi:hypothetical protein